MQVTLVICFVYCCRSNVTTQPCCVESAKPPRGGYNYIEVAICGNYKRGIY